MKNKKFLLNTKDITSAAAQVCMFGLVELEKLGQKVDMNIWDDYRPYDYVIFMSGSEEIDKARNENSKLIVGLADPCYSIENVISLIFA